MKTLRVPTCAEALSWLDELASSRPATPPPYSGEPLILYGAGRLGRMAADLFQRLEIPIAYALDCNPPADGCLGGNIEVIRPEAADSADHATHIVAVCVVTAPYEPIRDYLLGLGWRRVVPVYDLLATHADRIAMTNGWFAGPLGDEDVAAIGQVLARWDDDVSRAAYLQMLAWRTRREEWDFPDSPVRIDDRYFIAQVVDALGSKEHFLDAGSHHGAVVEHFAKIVKGRFARALAVEPDRQNLAVLRTRIASMPEEWRERIDVADCALAADGGRHPFSGGLDMASRLVETGREQVQARRLDDLDFPATFAKIHLEGGELGALRGGSRLLTECRPIVAVTIYHSRDGLWRIPHFLMKLLPDYRMLMRAHGWCGTGCVVYAIPEERWSEPHVPT